MRAFDSPESPLPAALWDYDGLEGRLVARVVPEYLLPAPSPKRSASREPRA